MKLSPYSNAAKKLADAAHQFSGSLHSSGSLDVSLRLLRLSDLLLHSLCPFLAPATFRTFHQRPATKNIPDNGSAAPDALVTEERLTLSASNLPSWERRQHVLGPPARAPLRLPPGS